jgi:hypothetical protein
MQPAALHPVRSKTEQFEKLRRSAGVEYEVGPGASKCLAWGGVLGLCCWGLLLVAYGNLCPIKK